MAKNAVELKIIQAAPTTSRSEEVQPRYVHIHPGYADEVTLPVGTPEDDDREVPLTAGSIGEVAWAREILQKKRCKWKSAASIDDR